jgi:hypothetical protein
MLLKKVILCTKNVPKNNILYYAQHSPLTVKKIITVNIGDNTFTANLTYFLKNTKFAHFG